MVEVRGIPILAYHLQWLQRYGVDHAVVACGYYSHVIQDYFGDGADWGLSIDYCVEEEPLGRGGGLAGEGKLRAFRTRAFWRAVDTVKDLSEFSREVERLGITPLFPGRRPR